MCSSRSITSLGHDATVPLHEQDTRRQRLILTRRPCSAHEHRHLFRIRGPGFMTGFSRGRTFRCERCVIDRPPYRWKRMHTLGATQRRDTARDLICIPFRLIFIYTRSAVKKKRGRESERAWLVTWAGANATSSSGPALPGAAC